MEEVEFVRGEILGMGVGFGEEWCWEAEIETQVLNFQPCIAGCQHPNIRHQVKREIDSGKQWLAVFRRRRLLRFPADLTQHTPVDIPLSFVGPFTFTGIGASIFEAQCANAAGIYLWTIRQRSDNSHLIHYVGETTNFGRRHRDHLIHILGLNYGIFHSDKAQDGICELLWTGLWRDKSAGGPARQIEAYHAIHEHMIQYLSTICIFFAELHTDDQLRKHIEGCVGWNLRNKHPECKALYPDDNHVGTMADKNRGLLRITVPEVIRGLDSEIPY